jgi:hypothetical protein
VPTPRRLAVAALALGPLVALSGCGTADPLAKQSGDEIARKIAQQLTSAGSYRVQGVVGWAGAEGDKVDLRIAPGHGCTGSLPDDDSGVVGFTLLDGSAWARYTPAALHGSGWTASEIAALGERYLSITPDTPTWTWAKQLCGLPSGIVKALGSASGAARTAPSAGHPGSVTVTFPGGSAGFVATDEKNPRLLHFFSDDGGVQIEGLKAGTASLTLRFSEFSPHSRVAPPPLQDIAYPDVPAT